MTRNDLILTAGLMILSLVPCLLSLVPEKNFAVVKVDGIVVRELDLTEEKIFAVEAGSGKNILEVKGGAVRVVEADCPDKICVRRGAIKNLGETIACVPHKILIEVVGE